MQSPSVELDTDLLATMRALRMVHVSVDLANIFLSSSKTTERMLSADRAFFSRIAEPENSSDESARTSGLASSSLVVTDSEKSSVLLHVSVSLSGPHG